MRDTDFQTKRQLKEQIALPGVGVKYSDGKGNVRDFSVGSVADLGSLDAAFGAAAAGVRPRQAQNLQMAREMNVGKSLKPAYGSAIVVDNARGCISLKGETDGENRGSRRFFGTDAHKRVGWHSIDDIDKKTKGANVGPELNVEAKADTSKREGKGEGSWSYQISRTAYKKDEDTGVVSCYNYFRTVYVTNFGRSVELSPETEVLVTTIDGGMGNGYTYCCKPVFDESDANKTGPIKYLQFGTPRQFKVVDKGQEAVDELQAYYDSIKDDPLYTSMQKAEVLRELNEAKSALANAEGALRKLAVCEFGVKPEFNANGILTKLTFGSAYDVQKNAGDTTKVKVVNTQIGCPYQGS